jgi:hypothetical protein
MVVSHCSLVSPDFNIPFSLTLTPTGIQILPFQRHWEAKQSELSGTTKGVPIVQKKIKQALSLLPVFVWLINKLGSLNKQRAPVLSALLNEKNEKVNYSLPY